MIISQRSNGTQNGSQFGLSKGDEKRKCYELFTTECSLALIQVLIVSCLGVYELK